MGNSNLFVIFVSAVLINNCVMSRFMGICPFLGVSKKIETSIGMSVAVAFVIVMSSLFTFVVYEVLKFFSIEYLYNVAFILIIAAFVQLTEMFIKKTSHSLYKALGVYLPLITTNCAVLGVVVLNMQSEYSLVASLVNALGVSAGFAVSILLFAGIRERLAFADVPKAFHGFPLAMVTSGLMSIAFFGFAGLL